MDTIPRIRHERYLLAVVLGLICASFLNMLYCTMSYEFGWGPSTFLVGPEDRFADVIKLSLSFRRVSQGANKTEKFQSWEPVYRGYYEHPGYAGTEGIANGELTHFHHPPLSTLIFLLTGAFIVKTSPTATLLAFFAVYLFEVWSMICIGVPRARRTPALVLAIWFLCLASYPALVMFGRGNYVNAGLTTVPIVAFLLAIFGRKEATLAALTALAIAVNIHPNAIIFLLAVLLVFGIREGAKPVLQFIVIASMMFAISYVAAHKLYPDYTIANFRKGLAIYGKIYIENGGGIRMGSSLYGLVRALNHGLHVGMPFSGEISTFYILATAIVIVVIAALWRAWNQQAHEPEHARGQHHERNLMTQVWSSGRWPLPLIPFLLVSLYNVLSPIFADYHLLVFLAPLLLAYFDRDTLVEHSGLLNVVSLASLLMLCPKNYPLQHASIQVILNPIIVCGTTLWLGFALLKETRPQTSEKPEFSILEGR